MCSGESRSDSPFCFSERTRPRLCLSQNNMSHNFPVPEAIAFDDVLLLPARSDGIPTQTNTQTKLRRNIANLRWYAFWMPGNPGGSATETPAAFRHPKHHERLWFGLRRKQAPCQRACRRQAAGANRAASSETLDEITGTGTGKRKAGPSQIRHISVGDRLGWLRGVDLNHRPLGYEPNELPDCSTPRFDDNNLA